MTSMISHSKENVRPLPMFHTHDNSKWAPGTVIASYENRSMASAGDLNWIDEPKLTVDSL